MRRVISILNRTNTIFACSLMFFWNIGFRMAFFSLVPVIAKDVGFNVSQAGLLVGLFYLGYSLSIWGSAFIPISRKTMIIAGALASLFILVLLSKTRSLLFLLILTPFLGTGLGFYLPRGVAMIADASNDHNRGRNLGFHEFAGVLGMILAPLYVGEMLNYWGWNRILIVWGFTLIIALIVLLGVKENSPAKVSKIIEKSFKPDKLFLFLSALGGCIFLIIVGLTSVLPMVMVNIWNINAAYAASYLGITRLAGAIGPLVGGSLSDRWGRLRVLLIFFSVCMLSLVTMMFTNFSWAFTLLWLVLIFASHASTPIWITIVTESYSSDKKDKAFGLISGSASLLGSVLAPSLLGLLIERFSLKLSFGAAALCILGGILVIGRLSKRLPGSASKVSNISHI